jgi:hypothetical protein
VKTACSRVLTNLIAVRFLKRGNFPAVLPGAGLSRNAETSDFYTVANASFEEAPAAGIRVASPKPGPWFAVAYLPAWDDKVELKVIETPALLVRLNIFKLPNFNIPLIFSRLQGVTHKCRYSIGAVARWVKNDAVPTLLLGRFYELVASASFQLYRCVPCFLSSLFLTLPCRVTSWTKNMKKFNFSCPPLRLSCENFQPCSPLLGDVRSRRVAALQLHAFYKPSSFFLSFFDQ